jgi:hypothetical protein
MAQRRTASSPATINGRAFEVKKIKAKGLGRRNRPRVEDAAVQRPQGAPTGGVKPNAPAALALVRSERNLAYLELPDTDPQFTGYARREGNRVGYEISSNLSFVTCHFPLSFFSV